MSFSGLLKSNQSDCQNHLYWLYSEYHCSRSFSHLSFFAGAGSAGLGVCAQILDGLRNEGLSTEEARKKFVVFSHKGVLGELQTALFGIVTNDFCRCHAFSDSCFVVNCRQERWSTRVASPQQRDLAGDAGMGQRRLQRWRQAPGCDPQVQTHGEAFVRLWSGALTFLYELSRVMQPAFPHVSRTICVIFSRGHTHVRCCWVCPHRGDCSTKKWSRPCTNTGMIPFSSSFPCFRAHFCNVTLICTDFTAPIRSSCPCPTPLPR